MQIGRNNPYATTPQTTTNYDNKKVDQNKDGKVEGKSGHHHHHHTKPADGVTKTNGTDTIQFSQKSLDALNKTQNSQTTPDVVSSATKKVVQPSDTQ